MGSVVEAWIDLGLADCADLVDAIVRGAAPDENLPVVEWAERHMVIPKDAGAAEPGPYRVERTPYARGVMDALSLADPCRKVVVVGASQMLKTQVALNWILSTIHQAPANILVLLPTQGLAKRASARISKAIAAVDEVRDLVSAPRSRDSQNTIDTKEFDGGTMYITTAGAAANLSEISARWLYCDEVDRWLADVDGEGDPAALALKRLSTFANSSKAYFSSSPVAEGNSPIEALFAASTQRRYFVPCPHCGDLHTLEWENVRVSEALDRAWIVCPSCGAEIDEGAKATMLPAGEWRASAAGDGQTEGFRISALYMPLGWSSWLDLAREHAAAQAKADKGDDNDLKVFTNTRLALPYKRKGQKLLHEVLAERARLERHEIGVVPLSGLLLTMSVDVQGDRLEYQVVAWGRGEESWLVDFGRLYGDPGQELVWQELDAIRTRPLPHACGATMRIEACAIDSGGHHTHEVYAYCRLRSHQRVFAVKGDGDPKKPVRGKASMVDVNWRGKTLKHGCQLWFVGTHTAKNLLANRFQLAQPGPGFIHLLPAGLPEDYFEQLTAEERISVKSARGVVERWQKVTSNARNEAWDLWVYALFAAHALDTHKFREAQWDRLEALIAPRQADLLASAEVGSDDPPAAAPSKPPARPPRAPARRNDFYIAGWSDRL